MTPKEVEAGMAMREPTVVELLEGLGHTTGRVAARKHERMEAKLREARSIIKALLFAHAGTGGDLDEALGHGREHLQACGWDVPDDD